MDSNSTWLNSIWMLVLGAVTVYLVLGLLLYLFQSHLLYLPNLPSRAVIATPRTIGLDFDAIKIETDDGIVLDGWFVPAMDARGVLLFLHGNAGNISHRLQSIEIFHDLRLSILIIDYRGYGDSAGEPSEQGTYRDAMAAWRYLTDTRRIPASHIVLFGRSLGAAVAANLASRVRPAGLILESAFTSAPDLAAHHYWIYPVRWLTRFRYDTRLALTSVRCPVLVIHSRYDEIIPFRQGRDLFDAAGEPKQFLELRGSHNDGFLVSGRAYRDGISEFLTVNLGK